MERSAVQRSGARPIDQFAYRDNEEELYLYDGGWEHLSVVQLGPDLRSLPRSPDRTKYLEITLPDNVEGSFVVKWRIVYDLTWSEGGWTLRGLCDSQSPVAPFEKKGVNLQGDEHGTRCQGHHSVVQGEGPDNEWIAYHRRPLGEAADDHWVLAVDRLVDRAGRINQASGDDGAVKLGRRP